MTRPNHCQWSPTARYAVPAGPRRPTRRGSGDAFDDAPRLGLGEGQAGGAVGQAERLADLALRERLLAGHEIGLHPGDRRGHAPGGAHLAPRLGELESDRLRRSRWDRRRDASGRRGALRRGRAPAPPFEIHAP